MKYPVLPGQTDPIEEKKELFQHFRNQPFPREVTGMTLFCKLCYYRFINEARKQVP